MTSERWKQIEQIFQDAMEHPAEQRQRWVESVCAGDEGMRREVEVLLSANQHMGSFLAEGAIEREFPKAASQPTAASSICAGEQLGHYKILSKLGAGGMGEVWLALDTKLERQVALKVLPARFTQDVMPVKRFEREAKAASALNHPNIITIYEIGEVNGTHFIATELVLGSTLRERISDGPLNPREALDVVRQVAAALAEAHQAGIVHRDIKPENIMVRPDGLVKVLDFGLAKLVERPVISVEDVDSKVATRQLAFTQPGMIVGTLGYLSPEQARGLEVDARTDIFSLGVVIYEMITGNRPFTGPTASDLIASILLSEPPPLSSAPAELQQILDRALRKEPGERYQTVKEIEADLKKVQRLCEVFDETDTIPAGLTIAAPTVLTSPALPGDTQAIKVTGNTRHRTAVFTIVLAAILSVVVMGIAYFSGQNQEIDSLAIMPLVNAGGNSEMEYLSDGLTESLINNLSQLPDLKVMSRNAVFRYKNREIEIEKIAGLLKVQAVLAGRVEQRGDHFTISLELVDARDNHAIWGNRYQGKLADMAALESTITQEFSRKLRTRLSGAEQQQMAKRETESSEAHQFYLKGSFHFNKYTQDGYIRSIEFFQQAIYKDPNYALAYVALARAYSSLSSAYRPPPEVMPLALLNAQKAIELDDTLAEAHATMASIQRNYYWSWAEAKQECERALALNPSSTIAHRQLGYLLQIIGRSEEAIESFNRALELDPFSLSTHHDLARVFLFTGRYEQAIATLRRSLEVDPNLALTYVCIAEVYGLQGKYEQALAELARAEALDKDATVVQAWRPQLYAKMGRTGEARQLIAKLLANPNYLRPDVMAGIYTALGQNDEAFAWLEKGFEQRSSIIPFLNIDPTFDRLRTDPRFGDLLRRLNLPPAK